MISWFEKHNKISWAITVLIAIMIFYVSSLTFGSGTPGKGTNLYAIIYHIAAFFFFTLFLLFSLVKGKNYGFVFLSIIIATLYGFSDEFHQYFVPGRSSSLSDVFLDFTGTTLAVLIYLIILRYKKL